MKENHAAQVLLVAVREATLRRKLVCFFERAKQTIPPRYISVVEIMNIELMVDRMVFRSLDEISEPVWRAKIGMVKVFAHCSENVEPLTSLNRPTEQRKHDGACDHRVGRNLDRVLVERCQHLYSCRTVVNLVAHPPEKTHVVAGAVHQ